MKKVIQVNGFDIEAIFDDNDIETIYIPLLKELNDLQKKLNRRIFVFIGACPGTGKTTFVSFLEWLAKEIGIKGIQSMGMDGFHYTNEYLLSHTMIEDGKEIIMKSRKGGPETFDVPSLKQKIEEAKCTNNLWPIYSRILHDVKQDQVECIGDIILLEGNYLWCDDVRYNTLEPLCDYSIMILEDEEVLRQRLLERKIRGGLTREEALPFCEASDYRNIKYVLNTKKKANLTLIMDNYKVKEVVRHEN